MRTDRLIQLAAALLACACLAASGALLPSIVQRSEDRMLRYTNVAVDGAPPIVALGTAIGAVRGLIADYLWIKVNLMKDNGQFYEVMADTDLITKLQPRFAAVWAFHGHNMAYNISVATHTQQERWEWVNAGIRLVRNNGLRYNPNNMMLHRELAFWFAHKIEGVADDAHLYYKRALCEEWHLLLGEPPDDYKQRIAWIKEVADAPETLVAAEQRTPGVSALVERLRGAYQKNQAQAQLNLDKRFLTDYGVWVEINRRSAAAKLTGFDEYVRKNSPYFSQLEEVFTDPALQAPLKTLVLHVRKRVLKDEYNMDPQLMYEYTRDVGPIDWRHGSAHALYWSRRGSELGRGRVQDYDVYIILNNDSQQIQAMQDLARWGRISFDMFSSELPGRFPDPRWIDSIYDHFEIFYKKHYNVHGAGGERFINFIKNFIGSAVCEWYRAGETQRAENLRDKLRALFNVVPNSPVYDPDLDLPLDVYVWKNTFDQYQAQPHTAPRDIAASLRYGFRVGILANRPEVLRDALLFSARVTHFFKEVHWNNYVTKFGQGRMADILGALEDSAEVAYLQTITDPGIRLQDRMTIWAGTDAVEGRVIREAPNLLPQTAPVLRAMVYDRAMPALAQQFAAHELSTQMTLEQAFPAPPGLDRAREAIVQREAQRQKQREEAEGRDPIRRQ